MVTSPDRMERLLALLLTQNLKTQRERVIQLSIAGFSNLEIADILNTSNAVVAQVIYAAGKSGRKRSKGSIRRRK